MIYQRRRDEAFPCSFRCFLFFVSVFQQQQSLESQNQALTLQLQQQIDEQQQDIEMKKQQERALNDLFSQSQQKLLILQDKLKDLNLQQKQELNNLKIEKDNEQKSSSQRILQLESEIAKKARETARSKAIDQLVTSRREKEEKEMNQKE